MRRSHSLQLLASIIVFLVIALAIIFNVYHYQGKTDNDNSVIQALSLVSATALGLGGSFLGTTVFWLLFDCDFSNRKRLRKMDDRINKTENIERINQKAIDDIIKGINSIKNTQKKIERSQEEQEKMAEEMAE